MAVKVGRFERTSADFSPQEGIVQVVVGGANTKSALTAFKSRADAGSVTIDEVMMAKSVLENYRNVLNIVKDIPGLNAAAQAHPVLNDPTIDLRAGIEDLVAEYDSALTWLNANMPIQSFTPAQTTPVRNGLQRIIDKMPSI